MAGGKIRKNLTFFRAAVLGLNKEVERWPKLRAVRASIMSCR